MLVKQCLDNVFFNFQVDVLNALLFCAFKIKYLPCSMWEYCRYLDVLLPIKAKVQPQQLHREKKPGPWNKVQFRESAEAWQAMHLYLQLLSSHWRSQQLPEKNCDPDDPKLTENRVNSPCTGLIQCITRCQFTKLVWYRLKLPCVHKLLYSRLKTRAVSLIDSWTSLS